MHVVLLILTERGERKVKWLCYGDQWDCWGAFTSQGFGWINSHNKIRHLEEYSVPLKIKSALITALVITWKIISSRRGEPAGILSIYTYIFLSVIFVYVLRLSVRKWPVFRSCEGFFHLINRQINGAALLHLAVLCLYAITVFNFSVNNFWGKQICVCMFPHFFFFLCFSKNLEMGRFICRI